MGVKVKLVGFTAIVAALTLIMGTAFAATVTSKSQLGTSGVQKSEVSLGDLIADAMREALDTDFAFVSASEIKERDAQIAAGTVSTEDVTAYVAFADDPIVEMKLTGKQIRQAMERSVFIYPKNNLGFLQISGLRVTFDPNAPQENRVKSILVGDKGNKALSDNETYTVAMTSSMANGALGYWKIWTKEDKVRGTELTIPDAIEQFFSSRNTIDYSNLNRIVVAE
ncbi:MAG TPA: 5'-nucleotidase [Armatimonadota bacterium]|nr:5'-nucleotidase [Armatimonadota bacterium]